MLELAFAHQSRPLWFFLVMLQDLVPVKFTPIADRDSKTANIVKETRYMCPVTRDVLSNSVPCVLLRPRYVHM